MRFPIKLFQAAVLVASGPLSGLALAQSQDSVPAKNTIPASANSVPGRVIGNGGHSPSSAQAHLAAGDFDLISFGRLFIANPDLVARLRQGQTLRDYHHDLVKEFR